MKSRIYILVVSGSLEEAQNVAESHFPGCEIIILSKRDLREGGLRRQFQQLRKLKGHAFLVFAESIASLPEPLLLKLTILFHRCRVTAIADSFGQVQIFNRWRMLKVLPEAILSIAADLCTCLLSWVALHLLRSKVRTRQDFKEPTALDAAYLYPFPMDRSQSGGAMSHVAGFLSGLDRCSARCEVFSGRDLSNSSFPVHEIQNTRRFYLFREPLALSYNLRFVNQVEKHLRQRRPLFIYQRHGRYVVVGALLSRRLGRPLVLEYNGSEVWIAKHWDPTRFLPWLNMCEEISLAAATLVTVVSDALKNELIERGIPEERILLNPNSVDPDIFHPDCGGNELRRQLGFLPQQVVVGFIGSFSYWHGIEVLQDAIRLLLGEQETNGTVPELRFLLVGEGPLSPGIRKTLEPYSRRGWVVFPGQVTHEVAPKYLDAADILVSPHVPMADGTPFFGSPTKLFEYMAMQKAIIASDLDQLARVLTHMQTGWLVPPGNFSELAHAIRVLAARPCIRKELGDKARQVALAEHTWQQNAQRVLSHFARSHSVPVTHPLSEISRF